MYLQKLIKIIGRFLIVETKHWKTLRKEFLDVPGKAFSNPKFVFSFLVIMFISSAGVWAPWAFSINLAAVCHDNLLKSKEEVVSVATKGSPTAGDLAAGNPVTDSPTAANSSYSSSKEIINSENYAALKLSCEYVSKKPINLFQGFAIFMLNVGLLGGVAFDFFIKQGPRKYEELDYDPNKIDKMRVNEYAGFFAWVVAFVLSFDGLKHPVELSVFALFGTFISLSLWVCINFSKAEFETPEEDPNNIEANASKSRSNTALLGGEELL